MCVLSAVATCALLVDPGLLVFCNPCKCFLLPFTLDNNTVAASMKSVFVLESPQSVSLVQCAQKYASGLVHALHGVCNTACCCTIAVWHSLADWALTGALCFCSDQPNCRVHIKLVDGDHRVAIYAAQDIPTGTELLYNYGNRFGKV